MPGGQHQPADVDAALDPVPRGSRMGGDDRHVLPGQRIEQARLADVGSTDQGDFGKDGIEWDVGPGE